MKDCNDCVFITFTEDQQNTELRDTGRLLNHKCKLMNQRLLHGGSHPALPVPARCSGPYSAANMRRILGGL